MCALQQYRSLDGSVISEPCQAFTREDGSRFIVTPTYMPVLSLAGNTASNFGSSETFYDAELAPYYNEPQLCFAHYANAGSYGQNQSFTFHADKYPKSLVPYCLLIRVRQWSNQGTVQVWVNVGGTDVFADSFHTDVGKNGRQTRVIMVKANIFEPYTAYSYSGVDRRLTGCAPWLLDYVSNRDNIRNLTVTTGAHWGDRGGYDYINVAMYMGILSELVDRNGIWYMQPSYY